MPCHLGTAGFITRKCVKRVSSNNKTGKLEEYLKKNSHTPKKRGGKTALGSAR